MKFYSGYIMIIINGWLWFLCGFQPTSFMAISLALGQSYHCPADNYCKISNISCTKSQNLNDSHVVLQLSLPNPLKPGVKSGMKMQLEQHRQVMLQLHLSDQQFYCLLRCILYYMFHGKYSRRICIKSTITQPQQTIVIALKKMGCWTIWNHWEAII